MILTRRYSFRAIHQHINPELSKEENERLFYKCSRRHGHNYKVEVTVRGELDPQTGLAVNRDWLDLQMRSLLQDLDGRLLNRYVENPSGENILQFLFQKISEKLGSIVVQVVLRETRKNSFVRFI